MYTNLDCVYVFLDIILINVIRELFTNTVYFQTRNRTSGKPFKVREEQEGVIVYWVSSKWIT